jgi:hypothetical protein
MEKNRFSECSVKFKQPSSSRKWHFRIVKSSSYRINLVVPEESHKHPLTESQFLKLASTLRRIPRFLCHPHTHWAAANGSPWKRGHFWWGPWDPHLGNVRSTAWDLQKLQFVWFGNHLRFSIFFFGSILVFSGGYHKF